MSLKSATDRLVTEFRGRPTLRAGSLIVTVFGDAVLPRGGTVWIGSLIRVLAGFGVNERLVRTSVFRLVANNWLEVSQIGRRSYYSLTAEGVQKFEQATLRIYGDPRQTWSGDWTMVLLAGLDTGEREAVRKDLGWLGFGAISANILAHPAPDPAEMEATLQRAGVNDQVVVMQGRTSDGRYAEAMRALVHRSWNLADIDQRYATFVNQFRPVLSAIRRIRQPDRRLAFQIRTLLIQEYRSILLRDPLLPSELLPRRWHGTAAYQICRNLYGLVYKEADTFMSSELESADGPIPPPAADFYNRFGGLK